ncbi:Dicer-like protein 2 [Elasticomyces elasticus]|nr:Dicer-like protein 2 [Elasticomyces elasticus]KAK3663392.1 Dicer-like protein 2 [Elasticomyces elasticus]KAK4925471.1 Dicer-like protein 2 [Elasticomyces elasticus]KAK5764566.1 Dicer-like protein 2 [Elasticomyces elasticus]
MADREASPDDRLRGYQREMLDASLRGNTIVVMPTGSGKTLIAVARIRAELERSDSKKLVWFIANSVDLCRQQLDVLRQNLPAYATLSLTGQDGVDNWSQQHLWDAVLANIRIVVGTPAVLKDALGHGFLRMSRIALLVFDEAHHCIKNHPMNAIMKNGYHPAKSRGESVPAVLGLTASPMINPKEGGMKQLEENLDAFVVTPKQSLDELMRYVYPAHLEMLTYPASTLDEYPGSRYLCQALNWAASNYNFATDPYVLDLCKYDDDRSRRALRKVLEARKTRCSEQLRMLNRRATTLYDQLGVGSASHYVRKCVERFKKGAVHDLILPDTTMSEQQHLLHILDTLPISTEASASQVATLSEKAECLIALLASQTPDFIRKGKTVIFAKERATVGGLSHILRLSRTLAPLYSVGSFVGTSTFDRRRTIADLADPRQQTQDLVDFRKGTKNLMVATSVLEEGIDVRECNLVINFDAPDTLIGFVQRRGRARMEQSKYYVLAAEDDTKIDPSKWQNQEDRMKQEYMDALRQRVEAESLDEEAVNTRVFRVASTGAMVTFDDAKAHLNHFCSVSTLQASNYVDTRPDYFAEKTADGLKWAAKVTLPSFLHQDIRTASSRETWLSEAAAIKDAAFEAYVALYKAGLLNDNLLALVKEPVVEEGEHIDQPRLVQVADRLDPWTVLATKVAHGNSTWHSTVITFAGGEVGPVEVVLPAQLLQPAHFELYWNEQISYSVTIAATHPVTLHPAQLELLRNNTDMVMRTVHESRMPAERSTDFMLLFVKDCDDPKPAASNGSRFIPGTQLSDMDASRSRDLGLVHVKGRPGLPYRLQRFDGEKMLVTRFPKRKSFLHPVQQQQTNNIAYMTEEAYLLNECSVDLVPLRSCLHATFLPSIMHQMETRLLAQDLQATLLKGVDIKNTSLVIEAITAPSAGELSDYNRLEYLGDSILKYCASLQVVAQHPTWPERYLSLEKSRLVRNSTLCQGALRLGLDKYITTKPFAPDSNKSKWRPPYVSKLLAVERTPTRQMSSKVLADVVEALIGAAYMDGGLAKAYHCIQVFLPDETWYSASQIYKHLTPDASPASVGSLHDLERLVGHHFNNPTLLIEAITHASLPFQRTGMSYERLEFLGDAVLDLIIVPKLHTHPRKLRHYAMHSMHEALVNGLFLGYCSMRYSIPQQQNSIVKGGAGCAVQQEARDLHLHDFIRASGQLLDAKQASLEAFEKYGEPVKDALQADYEYPWPDLLAMAPQKFLSDIVESVLGAIHIDTRGDLAACEVFLENLGVMAHMRALLAGDMETMQPKERLGVAAGNQTVRYVNTTEKVDGPLVATCTVRVGDREIARSPACGSKAEAEARAALDAVRIFQVGSPHRKRRKLNEPAPIAAAKRTDCFSSASMVDHGIQEAGLAHEITPLLHHQSNYSAETVATNVAASKRRTHSGTAFMLDHGFASADPLSETTPLLHQPSSTSRVSTAGSTTFLDRQSTSDSADPPVPTDKPRCASVLVPLLGSYQHETPVVADPNYPHLTGNAAWLQEHFDRLKWNPDEEEDRYRWTVGQVVARVWMGIPDSYDVARERNDECSSPESLYDLDISLVAEADDIEIPDQEIEADSEGGNGMLT